MYSIEKMFSGYEDSLEQFDSYRKYNSKDEVSSFIECVPVEEILRFWQINKEPLYKMFGEQLILSKDIKYTRSFEELSEEMSQCIRNNWSFVQNFIDNLQQALGVTSIWRHEEDESSNAKFYRCMKSLLNGDALTEGRIPYAINATIYGQHMNFSEGQKVMRAIGKVAHALKMDKEFEKFRIAQSMVLNQAKVSGKLCLSIHPLDFATASDNYSGWSSCMSWEEGGCYRLGTVEMMNSPYVICAYLASDSVQMDIEDKPWNSKKWRSWIIVTPDFIVANRNYPYENDDLMRACVDWVKKLAEPYYMTKYGEIDKWNQGEYYYVEMNYMYNDMGPNRIGCYARIPQYREYINISGEAVCMWCGAEIEYEEDDNGANTLTCPNCSNATQCTCCNTYISNDYVLWGPDDQPYCETCYNDNFTSCECCDNVVSWEDILRITIPVDQEWLDKWKKANSVDQWTPNELTVTVCKCCIKDAGIEENELTYEAPWVPFKKHSNWRWSQDWDGMLFNPIGKSWEKISNVFILNEDNKIDQAIWNHYIEVATEYEKE